MNIKVHTTSPSAKYGSPGEIVPDSLIVPEAVSKLAIGCTPQIDSPKFVIALLAGFSKVVASSAVIIGFLFVPIFVS